MTNPEFKPREFLLTVENRGDGLFRLFFNKFFELREENNFKEREQLHVIEKYAYDKLQSELKAKDELLRECEETLQSISHLKEGFEEDNYKAIEWADQLLQKLREGKKL